MSVAVINCQEVRTFHWCLLNKILVGKSSPQVEQMYIFNAGPGVTDWLILTRSGQVGRQHQQHQQQHHPPPQLPLPNPSPPPQCSHCSRHYHHIWGRGWRRQCQCQLCSHIQRQPRPRLWGWQRRWPRWPTLHSTPASGSTPSSPSGPWSSLSSKVVGPNWRPLF